MPSVSPLAASSRDAWDQLRQSNHSSKLSSRILGQLAKGETAPVNSHHHQAIETLGRELLATAWAPDGIVEAIEDPRNDRFVVGVQWHPELGWERDQLSLSLFNRFIAEARLYAEKAVHASETATVATL